MAAPPGATGAGLEGLDELLGDSSSCGDDPECLSSGSDGGGRYDDPEEGERQHFLDVCWSFLDYRNDALKEVARMQAPFRKLDAGDLALWPNDPQAWISEIAQRVEVNARFLAAFPVPDVCGAPLGPDGARVVMTPPEGHRVASRNSSKVRSTLRQFVRDWAHEGEAERAQCYGPLIDALMRRMPPRRVGPQGQPMPPPAVLCPGCGLARLPYDLARLGYAAQGNEFSYQMLLGSHMVLNRSPEAECHTIFPYVLSTSNRLGKTEHLRAVKVPNICPRRDLPQDSMLSMAAGEFVEVYKDQSGEWDAVLSCFFIDTAKNIFLYIRTIADLIRPGGLFVNIGPLLYHYADVEHEISVEPSWDEVRAALCKYFDIVEEDRRDCVYTTNPGSLMAVTYHCVFYVAVRNSVPVSGSSNPVF